MDQILKNIRFALRILARNPSFSVIAILALALGIGANTAIFTVVDGIVLKPLPYPESSRLVFMWERQPQMDFISVSYPNFIDWRQQQRSFEKIAAVQPESFILTGIEQPERLRGSNVSHEFFDVLLAKPKLGRTFTAEEDRPGSNVILISDSLWERRFGRDAAVIGKQLRLSSDLFTIIGVMPAGFNYPVSGTQTEVWTPLARISDSNGDFKNRGSHPGIYVVGRLLPQCR